MKFSPKLAPKCTPEISSACLAARQLSPFPNNSLEFPISDLVALYCAMPRDYLSDTSLLRAMGFLVSQHGQLGAIPPPPFSERFPLGEHTKWRCDTPPPPQKGYLSDTCAIPHENKANGCDTPFCDTISKGYCAIWGGILHWAAKISDFKFQIELHLKFHNALLHAWPASQISLNSANYLLPSGNISHSVFH